jgi:hypothetical protein
VGRVRVCPRSGQVGGVIDDAFIGRLQTGGQIGRVGRFLPDEAVSTSQSEIATLRHSVEARNDIQVATWINFVKALLTQGVSFSTEEIWHIISVRGMINLRAYSRKLAGLEIDSLRFTPAISRNRINISLAEYCRFFEQGNY